MKSYEYAETKHPDLFRLVDREGNWENYYHKPSGRFLTGITTVLKRGYPKGAGYENWLSTHTAQEREEILKSAGERGDKIHRLIDEALSAGTKKLVLRRTTSVYSRESGKQELLSNDEWDAVLSWARFWNAHKPVHIKSELPVFNLGDSYAGTGDELLILTQKCEVKTCKCEELVGKVGLYDWKTGSGIYPQYWSQLSAIAKADNIGEYLPKGKTIEYTAVLRLGTQHKTTGGYELKTETDIASGFARFLSAKNLADFEHDTFNPDKIVEIPDEVKLDIALYQEPKTASKPAKVGSRKKRATITKSKITN